MGTYYQRHQLPALEGNYNFNVDDEKLFSSVSIVVQSNSNFYNPAIKSLYKTITFDYSPTFGSKFVIECQIVSLEPNKTNLKLKISNSDGLLTTVTHNTAEKIKREFLDYLENYIQTGGLSAYRKQNPSVNYDSDNSMIVIAWIAIIIFIIFVIGVLS